MEHLVSAGWIEWGEVKEKEREMVFEPVLMSTFSDWWRLGPDLRRMEAKIWLIFYFCGTSASHIAKWHVTVNWRQGWVYIVKYCRLLPYVWVMNLRWGRLNVKFDAGIIVLLLKSTIRRTNRHQQYMCIHNKWTVERFRIHPGLRGQVV